MGDQAVTFYYTMAMLILKVLHKLASKIRGGFPLRSYGTHEDDSGMVFEESVWVIANTS